MGAVRAIWIAALVLAAAAAAVALLVARGGRTSDVKPPSASSVKASLTPGAVDFGDPVTAEVTVMGDRRSLGEDDVGLDQNLAPLTPLGPTQVTRSTRGDTRVVTYTTRASCIDQACTGTARSRRILLEPARVAIGGRIRSLRWPTLVVHSRVSAADVAQPHPPMRSDATPPPVGYGVSPHRLALALQLAAAVLAAAGVLLAGWSAVSLYRRRRHAAPLTGLERALALAREAEARPPSDRRRALGLLADALGPRNRRLSEAADELAWSAPAPSTGAVTALVAEVEHELNGDAR
jgi:hypothetical protein